MNKTNLGLVKYAKAQVGKPYWFGCFGQTSSESLYRSKKNQYPSYYKDADFKTQYNKRVHDCIGLIKGYLWSDTNISAPKYNSKQDVSAKSMYAISSNKGSAASFPKHAGMLLYKGNTAGSIHHVGVYGGDGYVYEAKGHKWGVVKTPYKASEWPFWSQCPWLVDDSKKSEATKTESKPKKKESDKKKEVKAKASASKYNVKLAGTYKVAKCSTLNMRDDASKKSDILVALPEGTEVKCYGYYSTNGLNKWLYVQTTYKSVIYTGFMSSKYLNKK